MARQRRIYHPHNNAPLPNHFAAFGSAEKAPAVQVVLSRDSGNWSFTGYTIQQPNEFGIWIAHFILESPEAGVTYHLNAFGTDNPTTPFGVKEGITFSATFPVKVEGIQPIYPTNGTTVSSSFSAYGTTTGTGQMGGGMELANGGGAAGTVTQGPPDWIISFQNLAPGGPYTLIIGQVGEPTIQISNLTVQAPS